MLYKKAITFSYDDGVTQDQRLIRIFDKYGLKCTFNLNSCMLGRFSKLIRAGKTIAHVKPLSNEIKEIYKGHEIAGHTLEQPFLPGIDDEKEIIRQINRSYSIFGDILMSSILITVGSGLKSSVR